jgi:hypothetical protein
VAPIDNTTTSVSSPQGRFDIAISEMLNSIRKNYRKIRVQDECTNRFISSKPPKTVTIRQTPDESAPTVMSLQSETADFADGSG